MESGIQRKEDAVMELLRKQIETERGKLNALISYGLSSEAVYAQSLVVDRLIEMYISSGTGFTSADGK